MSIWILGNPHIFDVEKSFIEVKRNLAIPHFLVSWKLYEDEKSLNALTEWRKTFAPRVKYIRKRLYERFYAKDAQTVLSKLREGGE